MRKEKLIKTTKTLLENIQALRESPEITKQQKAKINAIIKALNTLSPQEQNLVAYKYFEKKKHIDIAALLHIDVRTVTRKLNRVALDIGRMVYGFEDEFIEIVDESWNVLNDVEVDETEEQLINRAMVFVTNKMKDTKVIS